MGLIPRGLAGRQGAQFPQPLLRIGPESQAVDGEDGVQWLAEAWQPLRRGAREVDAPSPYRGGVAPGCLPHHDLGVVDAVDLPAGGAPGQFGDGDAGPEADFQHPVGGPHLQQAHRPAIAFAVGAAVREEPAFEVPDDAPRAAGLADQRTDDPLLEIRTSPRHDRQ